MSKVDWSLAPKWADHVVVGPLSGIMYWANEDRRIQLGGEFDCRDNNHVNEEWSIVESRPHSWSGPQDGLPPIGTVCECWNDEWERCAVVAHLNSRVAFTCPDDEDDERVYIERGPNQHEFRPIKTPQQLAAEQRETAIREIMDVAGIDCLVTATKLVDAGFSRKRVRAEESRSSAIESMKKVFDSVSDDLMPTSNKYLETLFSALCDAGFKREVV